MIAVFTRHCAMVLLIALKENICSENQRDQKVGKLFVVQGIRYINDKTDLRSTLPEALL